MTNDEFKYWIDGFVSLSTEEVVDRRQITIIKNHANLVKAIMGHVDDSIVNFMAELENHIQNKSSISLIQFKKIAAAYFGGANLLIEAR